jgi:hypothetical protein
MAKREITGWTKEDYLQYKHKEHPDDHEWDFEEFYCLNEIICQPEEYDGPTRYCKKYTKPKDGEGRYTSCNVHITVTGDDRGIEPIRENDAMPEEGNSRALTHGMYAEDENLKENWSEADEKIYDKVMGWAEDFGFEEGGPAHTQLESLAMSKVRELRSEKYLNENGEVVEREAWNPETEQLEEWEEVHELADHLRLKKKTILSMMKELGLTPKAQSQIGESDAKADEANAVAELTSEAIDKENENYDPEQFD